MKKKPELAVISAGSLIEFALADHLFSMPVDRIEYYHLGPMTFTEFLTAVEPGLTRYLSEFHLHQTIRVGMSPVFPPLKFFENGVIKGIEPDYLNLLSELTGIQFEYVVCDFPMTDAKVKSGVWERRIPWKMSA